MRRSLGRQPGRRPGRARRTSATSLWPRRMKQSSMQGLAATAHHPATGSARRPSKILSPPRNFARWRGRQKLATPARSGSPCASGNRNSMLRGGLVRTGGGRGPRVPVSSYNTPMLGRRYLTSWPSGGPRRWRRGLASAPSPQRGRLRRFRLRAGLTDEPPARADRGWEIVESRALRPLNSPRADVHLASPQSPQSTLSRPS